MTFQDRYTTVHALPKQYPAASPDPAGDDFETLLEASTLASPTVERIRRLTPPEVCKFVQARLDGVPQQPRSAGAAPPEHDVDGALLHLVRLCRLHRRPSAFTRILRSLLDHDALADVRADVVQEIVSVTFAGATRPPAVVVDTCLAVLDTGRIGDDLASRFAALLAPRELPTAARSTVPTPAAAVGPDRHGGRARPLADVLTLRAPRRHRGDRPPVTVFHGGHVEFGNVVGPAVLANWSRTLQLAIVTLPLLALALAGLVVFYLQLRPERGLGAAACAAGTAAAGGVGVRWGRRRLSRWRAQASPRCSLR